MATQTIAVQRMQEILRSQSWMRSPVIDRIDKLRHKGYKVERVRHNGAKVGDLYKLKCGELRLAIDAPRGKYRTAWAIIVPTFGRLEYYS